jgi:hypothetical protein
VRGLPEGRGAKIRALVGEDIVRALRGADAMSWIPLSTKLRVSDAIYEVLGETRTREFWSELMFDSYDHGLLKPLTVLARDSDHERSAGPRALLNLAPRAWDLFSRNCGHIELLRGDDGALVMSSVDLPREIARSRGFHCVFFGACQAMLDQFRSRGRVTIQRGDECLLYNIDMG